ARKVHKTGPSKTSFSAAVAGLQRPTAAQKKARVEWVAAGPLSGCVPPARGRLRTVRPLTYYVLAVRIRVRGVARSVAHPVALLAGLSRIVCRPVPFIPPAGARGCAHARQGGMRSRLGMFPHPAKARLDHPGVGADLTGQDAGVDVGAVLAQAAQGIG